jgi:hypothetical protein
MSKTSQIFGVLLLITMILSPSRVSAQAENEHATIKARAWFVCVNEGTRKYASSTKEGAETVVIAALGLCSGHESEVKLAMLAMHMKPYVGIAGSVGNMVAMAERDRDAAFNDLREGLRGKMVAAVLEERSQP